MSKFSPYEKYTLETSLSVDEVNKRLFENIQPFKLILFGSFGEEQDNIFQGTVWKNGFNISRRISYKNAFLPRLTGNIFSNNGKTYIEVRAKPLSFVLVFMCFCSGLLGLVSVVFFIKVTLHSSKWSLGLFMPGLMSLVVYGIMMGGFKSETNAPKKFLLELLEAEVVTN